MSRLSSPLFNYPWRSRSATVIVKTIVIQSSPMNITLTHFFEKSPLDKSYPPTLPHNPHFKSFSAPAPTTLRPTRPTSQACTQSVLITFQETTPMHYEMIIWQVYDQFVHPSSPGVDQETCRSMVRSLPLSPGSPPPQFSSGSPIFETVADLGCVRWLAGA